MIVNGVEISGVADEREATAYVEHGLELYGSKLDRMEVELEDEYANITYYTKQSFDRIRRITGYLVGTVDRWNSAKRAELLDRVHHSQEE